MEDVLDAAAFTVDTASKAVYLVSNPLSSINDTLSWIRSQLDKLTTSYDTKTRIIDTIEFMLRTLDNIKIHKRHHDLDNICEQLQIARRLCDQIIEKYTGHRIPLIDGVRKIKNASSIKEDLERVEKNITMANQKLGTCLSMLITEELEENQERAKEIKRLQENPDRGIYFGVDDINLPPTFELSAKEVEKGLELSWVPLSGCNTIVEKYELLYDKDQNECKMINDGNCTKVTISKSLIKPGKPYSMEIRGINKSGGKGKWSKTIVATISNPTPSKPPTPMILIVSPKEALVTVQTPIRSCGTESSIKHWLVEYTKSDTNNWKKIKAESIENSEPQEIAIKNLDPDKVYHFRVRAENAAGDGQPSDLVTKSTEHVDPLQPINLHLSGKTSCSILIINWQMPKGNQEFITHYEVRKRAERAFVYDDFLEVDKKDISYKFDNLKPKTRYVLQVRACNGNGKSSWAEILGETCSKTSALTRSLVAMLPTGKKDAKNKGDACASVFHGDNDIDESSINDSNTGMIKDESNKDSEHGSDDEPNEDTYQDALESCSPVTVGNTKDSLSDQRDDDDDIHVEDKNDKHNNSVEHNQDNNCTHDDSTDKEFRERLTNSLSHRPNKGTQ